MPKHETLRNAALFQRATRIGRRFVEPTVSIAALRTPHPGARPAAPGPAGSGPAEPSGVRASPPVLRVGVQASRKVGNAVVRNRARRRLREILRDLLRDEVRLGFDVVMIARKGADTVPFAALRGEVRRLLERSGVLRAARAAS